MKIIIYVRLYVSFIINVRNYIIIGVTSFNLGCNTILTDSGEFASIIVCKQLLHWHWLLVVWLVVGLPETSFLGLDQS